MAKENNDEYSWLEEFGLLAPREVEEITPETPSFVSSLWSVARDFFTAGFESVWAGFLSLIKPGVREVYDTAEEILSGFEEVTFGTLMEIFLRNKMVDEDDIEQLKKLKNLPFPLEQISFLLTVLIMAKNYLEIKSYSLSGTYRQELNRAHSPEPPRPEEVMQAAFVAPELTAQVRDAMRRGGLSEEDIDLLFLGAYRRYDENMIRELFLRGVLDEKGMYMRMRELGYTDERTKEIVQSWSLIPGPTDLLHMVAKEAFEPDMIEHYGYADEFPEEQVQWLQKQGLSREWALKYWYAHWETPSIQQGFEMLHRGVIDRKELDDLFRTIEIPPFWREKLTQVAYMPYTRVDTRRMHELGVLGDEELVTAYLDQGYPEEKAVKMAEFTIRYNQENDKDLTKSQIMSGYKDKLITKQDAIDLLVQIDYSSDQAEYMLALEDYAEWKEYQDDMIDIIKEKFQGNLITDWEARSRLNALNLPGAKVDTLLEKWRVRQISNTKLPSKSDLDKFKKYGVIDEDNYRIEMQRLGYSNVYIEWYLNLSKKTKGKA